jgi:hypothetical protein
MHGITASSQRTVDGTPRKEFNQKLRTSDQQNKNNSLDLLRSGVASYGALGHVPPKLPTGKFFEA